MNGLLVQCVCMYAMQHLNVAVLPLHKCRPLNHPSFLTSSIASFGKRAQPCDVEPSIHDGSVVVLVGGQERRQTSETSRSCQKGGDCFQQEKG